MLSCQSHAIQVNKLIATSYSKSIKCFLFFWGKTFQVTQEMKRLDSTQTIQYRALLSSSMADEFFLAPKIVFSRVRHQRRGAKRGLQEYVCSYLFIKPLRLQISFSMSPPPPPPSPCIFFHFLLSFSLSVYPSLVLV